eukprot:Lankesteria_metandrocarpae@DN2445_c0_g1_i3.p1
MLKHVFVILIVSIIGLLSHLATCTKSVSDKKTQSSTPPPADLDYEGFLNGIRETRGYRKESTDTDSPRNCNIARRKGTRRPPNRPANRLSRSRRVGLKGDRWPGKVAVPILLPQLVNTPNNNPMAIYVFPESMESFAYEVARLFGNMEALHASFLHYYKKSTFFGCNARFAVDKDDSRRFFCVQKEDGNEVYHFTFDPLIEISYDNGMPADKERMLSSASAGVRRSLDIHHCKDDELYGLLLVDTFSTLIFESIQSVKGIYHVRAVVSSGAHSKAVTKHLNSIQTFSRSIVTGNSYVLCEQPKIVSLSWRHLDSLGDLLHRLQLTARNRTPEEKLPHERIPRSRHPEKEDITGRWFTAHSLPDENRLSVVITSLYPLEFSTALKEFGADDLVSTLDLQWFQTVLPKMKSSVQQRSAAAKGSTDGSYGPKKDGPCAGVFYSPTHNVFLSVELRANDTVYLDYYPHVMYITSAALESKGDVITSYYIRRTPEEVDSISFRQGTGTPSGLLLSAAPDQTVLKIESDLMTEINTADLHLDLGSSVCLQEKREVISVVHTKDADIQRVVSQTKRHSTPIPSPKDREQRFAKILIEKA